MAELSWYNKYVVGTDGEVVTWLKLLREFIMKSFCAHRNSHPSAIMLNLYNLWPAKLNTRASTSSLGFLPAWDCRQRKLSKCLLCHNMWLMKCLDGQAANHVGWAIHSSCFFPPSQLPQHIPPLSFHGIITSMSQKLRRPILLVGVTGSPATTVDEVKCRGWGQTLPPASWMRSLVSVIILHRFPESILTIH